MNPSVQALSTQVCSKFWPQDRCSAETMPWGHCQFSEYPPVLAYWAP